MTTARLLSGRPEVEFREDGRRVLARDLIVDLGVWIDDLWLWAVDRKLDSTSSPVDWNVDRSENTVIVRVTAGFDYDGASLPFLTEYLLGPKELYELAGAVHDALFRWQAGRAIADHVFWIIARSGSKRVGPVRAWLGWAGLRLGGWVAYRKYRS